MQKQITNKMNDEPFSLTRKLETLNERLPYHFTFCLQFFKNLNDNFAAWDAKKESKKMMK